MKTIGIEAFLSWAYCEELPKAEATTVEIGSAVMGSCWDAVSRQGELMADTVSDGRLNSYGVVPLSASYGAPPHPDAFVLHDHVKLLAGMDLDLPGEWSPLEGLGLSEGEQADAVARAMPRIAILQGDRLRLRFKPVELLRRFAILRSAPSWDFERPKARFVMLHGKPAWFRKVPIEGAFGQLHEQEVDGYNPKAKRPYVGAYRKTVLDPDPALAAIDRAEYEVWHAALGLVVESLRASGDLRGHVVVPSSRPARPWLAPDRRP